MQKEKLVIVIYSHPDFYPPTINAVEILSKLYDSITIIHRNFKGLGWQYPANVNLVSFGANIEIKRAEKSSYLAKVFWFSRFTWCLFKVLSNIKKNYSLLIYDTIPILSYRTLFPILKRPSFLWYHNHDVVDLKKLRKGSITWLAWKSENWIFRKLNLFTLPSKERLSYFPLNQLKGSYKFLPNFPSKLLIERFGGGKQIPSPEDEIKLLFHGSIGAQHGFEELIPILGTKILGKTLKLVLKGFISEEYSNFLNSLACKYFVKDNLHILPSSNLEGVIKNSKSCHIGLAIYLKGDIMNNTIGTASNKIYEYAASGLPVIVFDSEYFRKSLGELSWVHYTDLTESSFNSILQDIVNNFGIFSGAAISDFYNNVNYEKNFNLVCEEIA